MATWVEDIRQALRNLGGKASLSEIYDEVSRIRVDPLPRTWQASIRERIEAHSSDSKNFKGKDYFYKIGKGEWGLRDTPIISNQAPTKSKPRRKKSKPHQENNVSPEEISMILSTLKDYRSYYHPEGYNWDEYIDQIFYILGFNIKKIDNYHKLISKMGSDFSPSAVVIKPIIRQNLRDLISPEGWESLLFYAAHHFHVRFGIITDGLQLKIIDYQSTNPQVHSWENFDDIVSNKYNSSFMEIYYLVASMKTCD